MLIKKVWLRIVVRRLAVVMFLAAYLSAPGSPSTSDAGSPPCQTTTVKVSCSTERKETKPLKFRAKLKNLPSGQNPSYHWEVSAGTITSGQGTDQIMVNAQGLPGADITATVQVKFGNCKLTDDCTTQVKGSAPLNAPPQVTIINSKTNSIVICPADPSRSDSPIVSLMANATDPENDTLTYTWRVNAGRITSAARDVKWDLSGVKPGLYTAVVEVSDGHTSANASITVQITECKMNDKP